MNKGPSKKLKSADWVKPLYGLTFVFSCFALVVLVRHVRFQGQDFDVFWKVARYLIEGAPVYDLVRDGAMSFKFPPWIVPLFVPFALLPLELAKWVWGLVTVFGIVLLFRQTEVLLRAGPRAVLWCALAFWGIFAVHQMDGQIVVPMVVAGLWCGTRFVDQKRSVTSRSLFGALAIFALSTKVFSVFAFLGFFFSPLARGARMGAVGGFVSLAMLLSLPALTVEKTGTLQGLTKSWLESSASGGELFDGEKIRGRDNQGLPALVLRFVQAPAEKSASDLWVAAFLATLGSVAWFLLFRNAPLSLGVATSFALSAALHPLAWFHAYVFAFPLCAWALSIAWDSKHSGARRVMAFLGVVAVALVTRKTLGSVGNGLELISIKALGVILLTGLAAARRA